MYLRTNKSQKEKSNSIRILAMLSFLILLMSCASENRFTANYKNGASQLIYKTNNDQILTKKNIDIKINNIVIKKNAILDSTIISRNKLPWFYFDWKEFSCKLGRDLITTDIEKFIELLLENGS